MKKIFITVGMLAAFMSSSLYGQKNRTNKTSSTPNIIIIYADDMGYGDLGVTGHTDIKTPNLDRMAIEGTRFTNYYCPSPASTASRYGLLTGRYPSRAGFRWVLNPDSERGIHPKEVTLAEALKEQGYSTGMFGKWHLGSTKKEYLPLQNGFDEYIGLPYSNDMIPPKYPDIALLNGNDTITMNPDQSKLTEFYTEKAISFIKKKRNEKFFIYLPYAMPHVPLFPGEKFKGKSKRGIYGDAVEEIDWYVGELLKTLKKEGLEENTIVWFMSDNGPWVLKNEEGGSAGLFRDGKGSTWEGGMRVPCIVQWKGTLRPMINEQIINGMDVFATCINLAGGEVPPDRIIDGRIITSYLKPNSGVSEKMETPFFYYGINNELLAVRKGEWKLHVKTYSQLGVEYFNKKLPLLFNVYVDPSEKYDLSDKHPEIVEELKQLIANQNESVKATGSFFD